jgi:hypothetical protein
MLGVNACSAFVLMCSGVFILPMPIVGVLSCSGDSSAMPMLGLCCEAE